MSRQRPAATAATAAAAAALRVKLASVKAVASTLDTNTFFRVDTFASRKS